MYIEHFDKCSDLKKIIYDNSNPNSMTDTCVELENVYNDYNQYGHLYNDNDDNLESNKKLPKLSFLDIEFLKNIDIDTKVIIIIFIFMTLIANIYLAIPLVPIMFGGSIIISIFVILLSLLLLFLIFYLFS
tara:strand:+ start:3175 stop:3567 length:393 start_codon:yes stop_codon:yes gene_type:complete